MKKLYSFFSAAVMGLMLIPTAAEAQCTTWVNPSATGGWSDFNTTFGGAPCDDQVAGCPFNEISAFEIWADEAYAMDGVIQGGTYTFSACNGVGGTAWNIEFTVVAPSGAVDAFGLDAGSVCELTWTASENGSYIIVVSEAGACGASANQSTDNGFPAITCTDGPEVDCAIVGVQEVETSESILTISPNPSNGIFTITGKSAVSDIEIFDVNGRLVESANLSSTGHLTYVLDLSGFENGAYVLRANVDGVQVSERLSLMAR